MLDPHGALLACHWIYSVLLKLHPNDTCALRKHNRATKINHIEANRAMFLQTESMTLHFTGPMIDCLRWTSKAPDLPSGVSWSNRLLAGVVSYCCFVGLKFLGHLTNCPRKNTIEQYSHCITIFHVCSV